MHKHNWLAWLYYAIYLWIRWLTPNIAIAPDIDCDIFYFSPAGILFHLRTFISTSSPRRFLRQLMALHCCSFISDSLFISHRPPELHLMPTTLMLIHARLSALSLWRQMKSEAYIHGHHHHFTACRWYDDFLGSRAVFYSHAASRSRISPRNSLFFADEAMIWFRRISAHSRAIPGAYMRALKDAPRLRESTDSCFAVFKGEYAEADWRRQPAGLFRLLTTKIADYHETPKDNLLATGLAHFARRRYDTGVIAPMIRQSPRFIRFRADERIDTDFM